MNVFLNLSGFDADGKPDYHQITEGEAGCECSACERCDQGHSYDVIWPWPDGEFCMMLATKTIRINNEYCYVCKECWFEHQNGGGVD